MIKMREIFFCGIPPSISQTVSVRETVCSLCPRPPVQRLSRGKQFLFTKSSAGIFSGLLNQGVSPEIIKKNFLFPFCDISEKPGSSNTQHAPDKTQCQFSFFTACVCCNQQFKCRKAVSFCHDAAGSKQPEISLSFSSEKRYVHNPLLLFRHLQYRTHSRLDSKKERQKIFHIHELTPIS